MWIVKYSVDYFSIPTHKHKILDNIKGAVLNLCQSKVIIFFTGSLGGGCIIGIICETQAEFHTIQRLYFMLHSLQRPSSTAGGGDALYLGDHTM
jgi:hypothetical protein